ncbi:hypothetical protein [Carboxylicivirga sp. RSCT41]|uniref:hypothetical protein n=1 Tax=Carboxylicivirga agarovorans TaxID=3417570 RepID=UPI003D3547BE
MKHFKIPAYILIIALASYLVYYVTANTEEHYILHSGLSTKSYTIHPNQDNILIDSTGAVLLIPKHAFIDNDGHVVDDSVTINYRSINDLSDLLANGINTSNPGQVLHCKQVFFIEAHKGSTQLEVDPDNPIYIELPAPDQSSKWQLFKGEEDKMQIDWEHGNNKSKYLIPFDFDHLDFYPEGFVETAEFNLPFRNYKSLSKEILDSLYYSFAIKPLPKVKIEHAGWLSFPQEDITVSEAVEEVAALQMYGIDPASIAALKSRMFANTYISTREFERRLKQIFKTCDEKVLEIYINNLDKNLYQADSLAAAYLNQQEAYYPVFLEFYKEKLTNVKNTPKRLARLAKYYQDQKREIRKALEKERATYLKQIAKEEQISMKKKKQYANLLTKRNQTRLNRFGFELTQTGWYNFAKEVALEELDTFDIKVNISNGNEYDRVHTYVINPEIKSLFALFSNDKMTFDMAHVLDKELLLKKGQSFSIVSVGFEESHASVDEEECLQSKTIEETLTLKSLPDNNLKKRFKSYSKYDKANSIMRDLEVQAFFYKENLKREGWEQDSRFIGQLHSVVFPCGDGGEEEIPVEVILEE